MGFTEPQILNTGHSFDWGRRPALESLIFFVSNLKVCQDLTGKAWETEHQDMDFIWGESVSRVILDLPTPANAN